MSKIKISELAKELGVEALPISEPVNEKDINDIVEFAKQYK